MTWQNAESLARAGIALRRRTWLDDAATYGARVVYTAGAGVSGARAVAVWRKGETEEVISAARFGAAEWLADDWEAA